MPEFQQVDRKADPTIPNYGSFKRKPLHLYSVSHGTVCFSAHWIFFVEFWLWPTSRIEKRKDN